MPRRINLLRAVLVLVFLLLALRLVQIQIVNHAHYVKLSVDQVREDLTTSALRGASTTVKVRSSQFLDRRPW